MNRPDTAASSLESGACCQMETYLVHLRQTKRSFRARQGETILAAARRNSVWLPAACETGRCGVCKGNLISGVVASPPHYFESATSGSICLCVTEARSELLIDMMSLARLG
jgi:CDP-4-dehydro-6-deoxyglucose reductase, E3